MADSQGADRMTHGWGRRLAAAWMTNPPVAKLVAHAALPIFWEHTDDSREQLEWTAGLEFLKHGPRGRARGRGGHAMAHGGSGTTLPMTHKVDACGGPCP